MTNGHLIPTLGPKRLDGITNEQVQRLRLGLTHRAPKMVNNVLTVARNRGAEAYRMVLGGDTGLRPTFALRATVGTVRLTCERRVERATGIEPV